MKGAQGDWQSRMVAFASDKAPDAPCVFYVWIGMWCALAVMFGWLFHWTGPFMAAAMVVGFVCSLITLVMYLLLGGYLLRFVARHMVRWYRRRSERIGASTES
jgi:hypothetical protein